MSVTDKIGSRANRRDPDRDDSDWEPPVFNTTTRPQPPLWIISLRIYGVTTEMITLPIYRAITIGRSDPERGFFPDLDLLDYGALKFGVSKRHAVMKPESEGLYLIDQASTNGSWVNRHKLTPNDMVLLNQGDLLEFGALPIDIIALVRPSISET